MEDSAKDEAATIPARKAALRVEAAKRRRLAKSIVPEAGKDLARHLGKLLVPKAAIVSGYWPLAEEIDVRPSLEAFHRKGHRIVLPLVIGRDQPLIFREWWPGQVLVRGGFGVDAPPPDAPEGEPDVLLVPMLAFDRRGYRLGYGGGYYDRTLDRLRDRATKGERGPVLAIGVAFSAQQVPTVPHNGHDQPLDWIVTEKAAMAFGDKELA